VITEDPALRARLMVAGFLHKTLSELSQMPEWELRTWSAWLARRR